MILSHLAQALLATGNVLGVEAALQEAFKFVGLSGERLLADVHRIAGKLALSRLGSDRARAEVCFLIAIEIARDQGARLLELRAATDLAHLWRELRFAQRSAPFAGANPRRDRGWRKYEGCPPRARTTGGERVTDRRESFESADLRCRFPLRTDLGFPSRSDPA